MALKRIVATLLTACLLICSFGTGLVENFSIGSPHVAGPAMPGITENTVCDSMARVLNDKNESTVVIISNRMNVTWMNIGSSTLVSPPTEIKGKIDANLLNLTGLVTEGYINDNQTNVIISVSNRNMPQADLTSFTTLFKAKTLYHSEHAYPQMNFFAAHLDYTTILELAESPEVDHVWLDRNFQVCLDQSVPLIKDPTEWAQIGASYNRSINGTGVTIAILDTGIDASHPDFYFPNATSKIASAISFTGESTADGYGHGTHCASIAAGTGAASGGQYTGVAPGATLLNVKVLDNQGDGQESWIISGIQWAVDHHANILSMSFGSDTSSDGTDPISTTVSWATQQGAVCAVAAGNSGSDMYTIGSPAAAELAITVGASAKDDTLASFSSVGPTSDNRVKPDLVAPGVNIVAARASGTSLGTPVSQYYTMLSGTSMATPHVAGAAALLLDAHPSWTPSMVKASLANYAKDLGSNVLQQGSGRIDVCKAVTASVIGNSSVGFGAVSLNTIYWSNIVFRNLGNQGISVTLSVETWLIGDGTHYPAASLSTSTLYISPGAENLVQLQLNTGVGLPGGYFEGDVNVAFGTTSARIPIFFCIVSQLNVEVVNEAGSKLMAAFSLIDATTGQMKAFCSESAKAHFTVTQGSYVIQAMNVYAWEVSGNIDPSLAFIIHQKFSLGVGETKNLQLSLTSAYKVNVRTTDANGAPLQLTLKRILSPYYSMGYAADMGVLASQSIYLTNISEYMKPPGFFGFTGLSADDVSWSKGGVLTSDVDAYFIGWDISNFGLGSLTSLSYANSELATFGIENLMPKSTAVCEMWFNQIAGLWQTGVWYGTPTHPGINWKAHILPYHYKQQQSENYSDLEWSCIYTMTTYPYADPEYFVIDRHFQPITQGENASYSMGKTPLLPQDVVNSPPYVGNGLYIPYYPLRVEQNLFIAKSAAGATKTLQVFKNGYLISSSTPLWAQAPIPITQFLSSNGPGLYTFVVNTGTSFNYSSQNTAEYTINYTSTSTDLIPPSITRIDCDPCFTNNEHHVKIQLADNDGISNVSLSYSTNSGPYITSSLTNLGNNAFSADLTLPTGTQKLSLIIEASDGNGNKIRYTTDPAATRGYQTQIDANLNGGTITGKLTVIGGSLLQPVYLKVNSNGQTMYTLTDANGNFAFNLPPSFVFQIEIEMSPLGTYDGSSWVINSLSVQTEPAGVASIPGGGWYILATNAVLTAPASVDSSNTHYRFSYWDVDGISQGSGVNPITVHMDVHHTATAHYITQYTVLFTQTGLSSDATSTLVTVNGNAKAFGDLPFTLWVDSGSSVTYSYNSPVSSTVLGKRFRLDSVTGPVSPITVSAPTAIAGNYKTQYHLTVRTDPTGIATIPGEGWYDEAAPVTLTASTVQNFQFSYWDVDGAPQGSEINPITVSMNTARTATAHYTSSSPMHDIAITNLTTVKNIVGRGFSTIINVTVTNQGNYTETFNITLYANQTIIATFENTILTSGKSTTAASTWNTTGFAYGNYTINAYASPVQGENDTTNNSYVSDTPVHVGVPGDVSGTMPGVCDGIVDMKDIAYLISLFNTKPSSLNWKPNADINDDGVVDMKDIALAVAYFREHE
ncbi:MAG: S8 family serine peptidase [Candidatus Bathyarchaeia archaeon]|jgi:serine protease AprX